MAYVGRAGDSNLSHKQTVWTNSGAVTYRHRIAYFCAVAYYSVTECAPFNSTAGANFNVIFYHNNSHLWNFFIFFSIRSKPKSITTDHSTIMNNYTITHPATFSY